VPLLLDVDGLAAFHPTKPLFDDLSFTVSDGECVGVVGINGSGKSTLLRILAELERPQRGEVRRRRDLRMSAMWQRPEHAGRTVGQIVGDDWRARAALDRLGLAGLDGRLVDDLSGGQARRVALAAALVDDTADLLILDEPTNHLDIDGIDFVRVTLAEHRGGVVLVTHDRHLLESVATRVVGLSQSGCHVTEGAYSEHLDAIAAAADRADRAEATRRILARKELEWLRRGARARRRKPKARLAVAHKTLAEPDRNDDRSAPLALEEFRSSRLGKRVIDLVGVSGAHDDGVPLFEGVDLLLDPRARIGVIGPNGAGKTTFLDVLASRRAPLSGEVERGATVQVGYFDQSGSSLDPQWTVEDVVAGLGNSLEHRQIALLERFWFEPATHRAPIATLSGGEQRRLQLLALLAAEPNVLLLDEPTNDLDLDTLRALEAWLDDFDGALVAVTHDRTFLERVVEHVIAIRDGSLEVLGAGDAVWERARGSSRSGGSRANAGRVSSTEPTSGPKRRSPSTLRHALAKVEHELTEAQQQRDGLAVELAGAADHQTLADLGRALAEAEAAVAAAEERWLEVAEEAEGIVAEGEG